jgi:hypothetical protein
MNQVLSLTRPNHDEGTTYLFHWSKPVIKLALKKKNKIVDIAGKKANKANFIGRLTKIKPDFVFFNGHGSQTAILGQNNEPLLSTRDKLELSNKLIIYSRSCNCASRLGPHCLRRGAKAFIGYTQPFIFFYNPDLTTHPLTDKGAELFLEPSNRVITTLLKGHSPEEADKRAKQAFQKNIQKLSTSETPQEYSLVIRFLFWDMKHQVCLKKRSN